MKKRLIVAVLGLVMIITAVLGCACGKQEQTEGAASADKAYTLEVVAKDGSSKSYESSTSKEFLKEAMDELSESEDFSYEEAGGMITTINGERADFNEDKAYWAIYVNDEYGQLGAAEQPVSDGDSFKFEYTPAE